ncbi:MAG: phosphoribosylformylglycinamidine synthase subunit PurL, partial [Nitrosopumilus sp.]|nr:phosphoribosylformylglycinamidine synthase subunit PurL [Nitrosopumilus sp.]
DKVPGDKLTVDRILFSESHSRYLLSFDKKNLSKIKDLLKNNKISFKEIGKFGGENIQFNNKIQSVVKLNVEKTHRVWLNSLSDLILHGKTS